MHETANCLMAALMVLTALAPSLAQADPNSTSRFPGFRMAERMTLRHAQGISWHGAYRHPAWNAPVPLVVPPVAHLQTKWSWGVSQNTMTPIYHQFRRPYHSGSEFAVPVAPTPRWPSHSDQLGVYYIRGPW